MPAVQPAGIHSADEKLWSICVRSSICHWQDTWTGMPKRKFLISKLGTINWFSSTTIAMCNVSTLDHKAGNNAVKNTALIMQGLAQLTYSLLPRAKSAEVFNCLGCSLAKKTNHHSTSWLIVNLDIQVYLVCNLVQALGWLCLSSFTCMVDVRMRIWCSIAKCLLTFTYNIFKPMHILGTRLSITIR